MASVLHFILKEGKRLILQEKVIDSKKIKEYICRVLKERAPDFTLQYYKITDNTELDSIENLKDYEGEILISLAVKAGETRLIDNINFTKNKS